MRIATVGTNFIVSWFIQALRLTPGAELAAVYSRREETAAAFAKKHGVSKIYTEKDALFADSSIDLIYVASPNSLHYAWTREALLAGRGVICEKPFVPCAAQLRELTALAMERGLFLFEALTTPHLPNYRLMRDCLPRLGPLRFVQMNFSQYSSRYAAFLRGEEPNVFSTRFAGGALMDLNYYNLCLALRLFGEPRALRYFPLLARGIDTSGALILQYPGFTCALSACKDSASPNFVLIQGENGWLRADAPASMLAGGFTLCADGVETRYNEQDQENVLVYELADFARDFASGDAARCKAPLADSLLAATLLERARREAGILFSDDEQ
jgi:predicted dehydrogenase